jgi:hypothetical protein
MMPQIANKCFFDDDMFLRLQCGHKTRVYGLFRRSGGFATLSPMFVHRTFIAGRSDRGAWPWRKPAKLNP